MWIQERKNHDNETAITNLVKLLVLLIKTNTSLSRTTELISAAKDCFEVEVGNYGHSTGIFERILESAYDLLLRRFKEGVSDDDFISVVADHGTGIFGLDQD